LDSPSPSRELERVRNTPEFNTLVEFTTEGTIGYKPWNLAKLNENMEKLLSREVGEYRYGRSLVAYLIKWKAKAWSKMKTTEYHWIYQMFGPFKLCKNCWKYIDEKFYDSHVHCEAPIIYHYDFRNQNKYPVIIRGGTLNQPKIFNVCLFCKLPEVLHMRTSESDG
jgi:hypothetical protein